MAFRQEKLDVADHQSRGIYNKYIYETSDSLSDVLEPGYFAKSRFKIIDSDSSNSMGWANGYIDVVVGGEYHFCQITSDGDSVVLIASFELITDPTTYTATFEALPEIRYRTDTTGGAFSMQISANFPLYSRFRIKDVAASWNGIDSLTVDFFGSGYPYQGILGDNFVGNVPNDGQTFIYMGDPVGFEQW